MLLLENIGKTSPKSLEPMTGKNIRNSKSMDKMKFLESDNEIEEKVKEYDLIIFFLALDP